MSRSRRKTPIMGITKSGVSEKKFKRRTHQIARATERNLLKSVQGDEDADVKLPRKSRDSENPWAGDKDGKSWFGDWIKKDRRKYEKWMRK